jgi:hypothetical protein
VARGRQVASLRRIPMLQLSSQPSKNMENQDRLIQLDKEALAKFISRRSFESFNTIYEDNQTLFKIPEKP